MDILNDKEAADQITKGATDVARKVLEDLREGLHAYMKDDPEATDPGDRWATWLTGFETGLHYAMHGMKDTLRLAVMIDLAVHDSHTPAHEASEDLAALVDALVVKHARSSEDFAKASQVIQATMPKKEKDDA